ncbi:MAG: Hsp20/alpha crystallin family protein [Deltaproteobacteria bacterium]|nr:Hsp20/alpha crystallin family protein [Deltaproteobacteria bacterium]
MFRRLNDIDRIFGTMDFFKNQMNRFFEDYESGRGNLTQGGVWPPTNFYDDGEAIFVYCVLPGMNENEVNIKLQNNLLTIKGERKATMPEGYAILRQERNVTPFSRSFTLPVEIDTEKTTATLKNGILTVKLVKAQAVKPKKIMVQAA